MTPVKSIACVFLTRHVLLWAGGDGPAWSSSLEGIRTGRREAPCNQCPWNSGTYCHTCPPRELLAQLDYSSSWGSQENPPGPAIPGMVGLEAGECEHCLCNSTGAKTKTDDAPLPRRWRKWLGENYQRILENFLPNSPPFREIMILKPNLKFVCKLHRPL